MQQAKIGPNSIIQTVEALKETYGIPQTHEILRRGNHAHLIETLPAEMVDEQEFMHLVGMLLEQLGSEQAIGILRRSGQLTGFYLLQHRIPRFFQKLLHMLPRSIALNLLLIAIQKNAWTFVGSGVFRFVGGIHARIIIAHRPSAYTIHPEACGFYCGTFEQIFKILIDPQAQVQPIEHHHSDIRCAYSVAYERQKK